MLSRMDLASSGVDFSRSTHRKRLSARQREIDKVDRQSAIESEIRITIKITIKSMIRMKRGGRAPQIDKVNDKVYDEVVMGRRIRKVVPCPGVLSTSILPSCAST